MDYLQEEKKIKKALVLFLLLSLTLTISFKTYAQDITWNDLPKSALKGLSLNEVFEEGLQWSDFIEKTNQIGYYLYGSTSFLNDNKYYFSVMTKTLNPSPSSLSFMSTFNKYPDLHFGNTRDLIAENYYFLSNTYIWSYESIDNKLIVYSGSTVYDNYYKNAFIINQTSLGIENLTLEQMDLYYAEYIRYQDAYTLHYNDDANPLTILEKLWDLLITYSSIVSEFLFTEQTIGFEGINILGSTILAFNFSFVPFYAIGGGTVTTLLILYLGKKFLPFV